MTTPMTAPSAPVVRAGRGGGALNVLLVLAALIAVGGIAFAVGRTTAPRTTAAAGAGAGSGTGAGTGNGGNFGGPRGSGNPGGFGGGFGGRGAGVGIRGTVTAVSPTSITIQTTGGGTITLAIDAATTYHQQVAGAASNVAAGKEVIVQLNGRNPNGSGPGASPSGATPSGGTGAGGGAGAGGGTGTAGDITVVSP